MLTTCYEFLLGPSSVPFLQVHYWPGIVKALRDIGANVLTSRVSSTGSIKTRALELHQSLNNRFSKMNDISRKINFIAHSMGGLDTRYLITNVLSDKNLSRSYSVESLTTISTPHRGSPFMDWCRDYLCLGNIKESLEHNLGLLPKPDYANPKIDQRISEVIKKIVQGSQQTYSDIKLGDFSPNDKRLGDLSGILNSIMLGTNSESGHPGSKYNNKKFEINDRNERKIIDQMSTLSQSSSSSLPYNPALNTSNQDNLASSISDKKAQSFGWGVTGGSYLAQSVVLMRQLYERIMNLMDTPAYYCLTSDFCNNYFNPLTPPVSSVKYYSYGAKIDFVPNSLNYYMNPLMFPHSVVYESQGDNDGFVSLKSAHYGKYIKTLHTDHFSIINRTRINNIYKYIVPFVYYLRKLNFKSKSGIDQNELQNALTYGTSQNVSDSNFDAIDFYLSVATMLYNEGH
ncbi:hypothetical protein BB560_000476 [Smittium megazygosporum]|uniref:DUF676 domain-containing protein n=1 Tax=Smittium megazygosporum TaxID=133381 RepID=A0A2T9ZK96_9FUNG|nr:hypothetical protein BB560_000476 [Smittium megazygosporum]